LTNLKIDKDYRFKNMKYIYTIIVLFFSTALFAQSDDNILTLQDAVEMAIEKNISIKNSELNLLNSELGKSDAIGDFLPRVSASANHQWNMVEVLILLLML